MAFTAPQFGCDVFVSYAHAIGEGEHDSDLHRWTLKLAQDIRGAVSCRHGFQDFKLFDDSKREHAHAHRTELEVKVKTSALMLIVMSDPYVSSAFCAQELEWFQEAMGSSRLDPDRVLIAQAMNTASSLWRPELRDDPERFNFVPDQRDYADCWYGPPVTELYAAKARELSEVIVRRLRRLKPPPVPARREVVPELRESARQNSAESQIIYLYARPEPRYEELTQRVGNQLRSAGLRYFQSPRQTPASIDPTSETKARIKAGCACRAMALVRADDNVDFLDDLVYIGLQERKQIEDRRRSPPFSNSDSLLCAVLDASGAELPVDISGTDIGHFDVRDPDWQDHFRSWLNAS